MKQLKIIILFALMMVGGIRCDGPTSVDHCSLWFHPPHYLEIENLTGEVAQIKFYLTPGYKYTRDLRKMVSFNLSPSVLQNIYEGSGRDGNLIGVETSPLSANFLLGIGGYDSVVVVVGDRREVFFELFNCGSSSADCENPEVIGKSPGWESSWNLLVDTRWELIEEPADPFSCTEGQWVRRFSLRPK